MHPTHLAVLAGKARPDLRELIESGEAEICYVENGHLPDQLARCALIVGPGAVGTRIAGVLRAVGMTVDGAGSRPRPATGPFRRIVDSSSLAEIVGDYDLVVVAAGLKPVTRGLISADVLRAMRSGAELINVGRGEIVDEYALAAVLREGHLGGAVLDVFQTEPLPEASPLWGLPNVIVSPHMAGDFFGWREALQEVFIDNFRRFAHGRPLRNVVDTRLGYVGSAPLVGTSREGSIG